MSSFILDNSVSIAWCFEEQATQYTDAILQAMIEGATAFVPAIWRLEVGEATSAQRIRCFLLGIGLRRRLPFATKDGPLRKAAEELRIGIFQP